MFFQEGLPPSVETTQAEMTPTVEGYVNVGYDEEEDEDEADEAPQSSRKGKGLRRKISRHRYTPSDF